MKFTLSNVLAIIGGLILLGAFFMPYIDIMFFKASGFKLVKALINREQGGTGGANENSMLLGIVMWGLFPLTGLMALLGGLLNKKYLVFAALVLIMLDIIAIPAALALKGQKPVFMSYSSMVGSGLYISLAGVALLLGFALAYRNENGTTHKPILFTSVSLAAIFAVVMVWFNVTVG